MNCTAFFHALCDELSAVDVAGNSVACLEVMRGKVHVVPGSMCLERWHQELDFTRRRRAEAMRSFLEDATPRDASGALLLETHDVPTLSPVAVAHARLHGVPVIAT